jgi:hypothetical protein
MFATIGRSWEFAKISYGILWDYKQLVVFPIVSGTAALAVLASFALPLWGTGTLEHWMQLVESETPVPAGDQTLMWSLLFAFYFCSYFVIVFFNCGLTACALKVVSGETPTIGYGMSMAVKRLPQIAAWAFISALIGVLLRAIESANEKVGAIVASILGSAWTALTYFVVPVLVMDGVGPFMAIKLSLGTLKSTWGEALVGHFSLGLLAFLVMLPVILVCGVLGSMAFMAGNTVGIVAAVAVCVVLIIVAAAATSAADIIFKTLLYNYATGRSVPASVDTTAFQDAFAPKK